MDRHGDRLFPFLIISGIFFFLAVSLSTATDIPLGSILRPRDPTSRWLSPSKTFSLGFSFSSATPSLFTAAISLSSSIHIWTISPDVDSSGFLELQSSGNLRLVNGFGTVVWETLTSGATAASLLDSGKFELSNGSHVLWDSFSRPTDTIVQTQNFTSGMILFSGLYSFSLHPNGNLTLLWNETVIYYNQGPNATFKSNSTITSPQLSLRANGIITLSDLSSSQSFIVAYSSDFGDNSNPFRYLRLDGDGNLRAYSYQKSETGRWSALTDQCEVFGWCGNLGICSYNDTGPICRCPSQNFEFLDPQNPRLGCRRKQELKDCPGSYTMLKLEHAKFLTYPPDLDTEVFFVGIGACEQYCLSGPCSASTSLADGTGLCYLKVSSFLSGYQSRALPSTSFVKVCGPGVYNSPEMVAAPPAQGSKKISAWIVVVAVAGSILGLIFLETAVWWCFCKRRRSDDALAAEFALQEYASGAPVQFSYKQLHGSTKGFKEKLGEGGFGAVYRGVLLNRTVVAVKQLEGIEQGEKQFRMEVATISSTHHLNLVKLIGFCSEGRHRLLVYEFMKNGSLDRFLFSPENLQTLSWKIRFSVALGTARGIAYLHEECRDCIVHCDIKPENILLDGNFSARVSDFGLAKLVTPKDHRQRTLTSVRGTRGYLAPEWLANLPITSRSDVFSFGMVLLEIVSGRRNFDVAEDTGGKKFSVWAYEAFERGKLERILDRRLAVEEIDMAEAERAVLVSFWCIQEQPSQRPSMGKVVQMLEGIMNIEKPPPPKVINGAPSISSRSDSTSFLSTMATSAAALPSSFESLQKSTISKLNPRESSSSTTD